MTPPQIASVVAGIIAAIVAAIVAIMRAGPDRTSVWVGTAEDLVGISSELRHDLEDHVSYLQSEISTLRGELRELRGWQRDRNVEMDALLISNQTLEDRVELLEAALVLHEVPVPPDG